MAGQTTILGVGHIKSVCVPQLVPLSVYRIYTFIFNFLIKNVKVFEQ